MSIFFIVIMAAADEAELVHMVATQVAIDDRPSALRYPRGEGFGVQLPTQGVPLQLGKGRILREGTSVAIVSFGARLHEAGRGVGLRRGGEGRAAVGQRADGCAPLLLPHAHPSLTALLTSGCSLRASRR